MLSIYLNLQHTFKCDVTKIFVDKFRHVMILQKKQFCDVHAFYYIARGSVWDVVNIQYMPEMPRYPFYLVFLEV